MRYRPRGSGFFATDRDFYRTPKNFRGSLLFAADCRVFRPIQDVTWQLYPNSLHVLLRCLG